MNRARDVLGGVFAARSCVDDKGGVAAGDCGFQLLDVVVA